MDGREVQIEFATDSGKLQIAYPPGMTPSPPREHTAFCSCWRCFSKTMGGFIDELGGRTIARGWSLFLTQTYRTPDHPWIKRFPRRSEPHPDFVHHFSEYMISWLEREFDSPVEFFSADQFGESSGRLHQHLGISSPSLIQPSAELARLQRAGKKGLPDKLKPFQRMLWDRAGFNRILPWLHPASHYIGRYIGRDASRCHWDWRVAAEGPPIASDKSPVGRVVVAPSPDLPSEKYHAQILRRWHR
jgi:hypothetical protein